MDRTLNSLKYRVKPRLESAVSLANLRLLGVGAMPSSSLSLTSPSTSSSSSSSSKPSGNPKLCVHVHVCPPTHVNNLSRHAHMHQSCPHAITTCPNVLTLIMTCPHALRSITTHPHHHDTPTHIKIDTHTHSRHTHTPKINHDTSTRIKIDHDTPTHIKVHPLPSKINAHTLKSLHTHTHTIEAFFELAKLPAVCLRRYLHHGIFQSSREEIEKHLLTPAGLAQK